MCDDITCENLHLASVAGMDDITCEDLHLASVAGTEDIPCDDIKYDNPNPECMRL